MRLLLLCLVLTPAFSWSQITLSTTDFANGGDTVRMSFATDPAIDFSSTGANYTWDFSGLIAEEQILREFNDLSQSSTLVNFLFGSFAPIAYQATYITESEALPLDQIGGFLPVNISEVNMLTKNNADSITSVGFSVVVEGTEVPFKSDTIETRYKFPVNFGDVYSSRGYSNMDLNPISNSIWRQHRQRDSNVDGWGSITTPFGTFDALRIRHNIQESDSLFFEVLGTGTWIPLPIPNSTIYEWWAAGELEPVLRITTNDILGTETVTAIEYRDVFDPALVSLDENELSLIQVYPNPVVETLIVEKADQTEYTIVNASGQVVLAGTVVGDQFKLSVEDLPVGGYQMIIRSGSKVNTRTFLKK